MSFGNIRRRGNSETLYTNKFINEKVEVLPFEKEGSGFVLYRYYIHMVRRLFYFPSFYPVYKRIPSKDLRHNTVKMNIG